MAAIELTDLTKHYKQGKNIVKALDGVSLTIQSGEFVAVVGRSGSGKTTMLDLLGLLLRPTAGRILIDGVDTGTLKDGERATMRGERIGFIFQEFNLLPTLNAIENVMLPLRYRRGKDPDGKARALRLLEEVDLADRVEHKPSELSAARRNEWRSRARLSTILLSYSATSRLARSTARPRRSSSTSCGA